VFMGSVRWGVWGVVLVVCVCVCRGCRSLSVCVCLSVDLRCVFTGAGAIGANPPGSTRGGCCPRANPCVLPVCVSLVSQKGGSPTGLISNLMGDARSASGSRG